MKFTQDFVEYRPLHIEDYLQESSAEHEGNAEVYRNLEMNERIDTNSKTMQGLFGDILTVQNLNDARRKVQKNKVSHGVDEGEYLLFGKYKGKCCIVPHSGYFIIIPSLLEDKESEEPDQLGFPEKL